MQAIMRLFLCTLAALPVFAGAQARIERVLVYPGGATVDRVVPVKSGQKELRLGCLPASFSEDSLQLAAPGVKVAELKLQTVDRSASPECLDTPLEQRIRALEQQSRSIDNEIEALNLAQAALKNVGQSLPAAQIASAAEQIAKSALAARQQQSQLQERLRPLKEQLAPLYAERQRIAKASPKVATLSARLLVERDTDLRISARTSAAGWQPFYRAYLDTGSGQLRIERHARVGQTTGEDWHGVKLVLSTVQPRERLDSETPGTWPLSLRDPKAETFAQAKLMRGVPAPAPTAAAMLDAVAVTGNRGADFDVSVFFGAYAAEFTLPVPVDVQSGSEKVALMLAQQPLAARVVSRVNPQAEAAAYLVAEATQPEGVWPRGPVQMFRDGAYVGDGSFAPAHDDKLDLPFGRDEQLRVSVLPEDSNKGEAGFIGSRNSKHLVRHYVIANRHDRAVQVQVLEATPVAQDDKIEVEAQLAPAPLAGDWRDNKGVRAWEFPLASGAEQKLSADYRITWPKDLQLLGAGY